jgi:glycosyltransferase involved in cell wall biosynthesis
MKIAHVVCNFLPYKCGIGNSVFNFSKYLLKFGHKITVFTPFYKVDRGLCHKNDLLKEDDGEIAIKRLAPFFSFGNAAILIKLFFELDKFDVIHLHYPFFGTDIIVALKKFILGKKIKLITHYHMDAVDCGFKGIIFRIYKKIFLPFIFYYSDFITCASIDYIKNSFLSKYFKKYPKKFIEISFGVDLNKFSYCDPNKKEGKNILFVGGLDKQHYFKGVENLIYSFKDIYEKDSTTKLFIVGRGDLEEYYKNITKGLGLSRNIIFINDADDRKLVELYRRANLFVLPSINSAEAFGLVILEAMSCGLPIIASNLPGVRSVFKNNENGFLVEPGNIEDLSLKIQKILFNPEKIDIFSKRSRELAEKIYSWNRPAEKLNNLYSRVKNSII